MQLTLWTYEGPPHVGAMRVATAMTDVHYVLHAPQGDTYADLLFTMIERLPRRPPVTYTTFQARDLGGDTAELFKDAARHAMARFNPAAMLVGSSCTAELIQDDPGGLAQALQLPIPVVALELPSYQRKENWGASETFYQLCRHLVHKPADATAKTAKARPTCNILGPSALGFRHRDDVKEITQLLKQLGVDVAVVAPLSASVADMHKLAEADFNVVLYPEIGLSAAQWLQRQFDQPYTKTVPLGSHATRDFIAEVCALTGLPLPAQDPGNAHAHWYAKSVDSTYLTGKRVYLFGDATHVVAAARIASQEMGFEVVGLGTYSREFAREVRDCAKRHGIEALITDDYLEVEAQINALQPELILGTQMERHIAKRHGIPCAVISAPVHVQDFPARYAPQMGFEGANVLFDTWVHPLMMGLEEHLIGMFREDFEFHASAAPSHLGSTRPAAENVAPARTAPANPATASPALGTAHTPAGASDRTDTLTTDSIQKVAAPAQAASNQATWSPEAEKELGKIPFFVRGKARRNTERFAQDLGVATITVETLYDAKAHYSR
ncbi:MAG: Light-independent protochlorophyllide reductase subunit [Pseudomonadota bacterium]|jgi:light-independent protochlorophyllide reductase subunit B